MNYFRNIGQIFCRTGESNKLGYNSMKRTFQRCREIAMPKPKTAKEVIKVYGMQKIMKLYGTTISPSVPETFYDTTHECDSFAYTVYSSKKAIALMEAHIPIDERFLYIDATFKVCPKSVYQQLLIIFVEHHKQVKLYEIISFHCIQFDYIQFDFFRKGYAISICIDDPQNSRGIFTPIHICA